MSTYSPDRWVMLEITSEKHGTIRKIFAGWYGGFAGNDMWKLNSGVTAIRSDDEGHYEFDGQSGSTYYCHFATNGMSGLMRDVLAQWREKFPHVEFKEIDLEHILPL